MDKRSTLTTNQVQEEVLKAFVDGKMNVMQKIADKAKNEGHYIEDWLKEILDKEIEELKEFWK